MLGTSTRNKPAEPATQPLSESLKLSESSSFGFVVKVLVGYLVLLQWLYPSFVLNSWFNKALCYALAWAANMVLGVFRISSSLSNTLISVDGHATLYVCTPCTGLDFVCLFGIVVFAYPSSLGNKTLFWLKGILIIALLNIVRITALALIHRYRFSVFEVNHHLVFNIVVYGCILWMFLRWARKW